MNAIFLYIWAKSMALLLLAAFLLALGFVVAR